MAYREYAELLALIMTGSGDVEWLWKWLFTQTSDVRTTDSKECYTLNKWKGRVISGMGAASIAWDKPRCVDGGLDVFLRVWHARYIRVPAEREAREVAHTIPLVQLDVWLREVLRTKDWSQTSIDKFEEFAKYSATLTVPWRRDYKIGSLYLNHPAGPQPLPALEAFRSIERHRTHPLRTLVQDKEWNAISQYAFRVARIIERVGGSPQDADWLVNFARDTWPHRSDGVLSRHSKRDQSESAFGDRQEPEIARQKPLRVPLPDFR